MKLLKTIKNIFIISTFIFNVSCKNENNSNVIQANGNLEFTEIQINSEVSGKIEKLFVDEGDIVKKDQIILKINSDILKAQLLQSKANLKINKARLASLEAGAKIQEIKQAEALVKQAQDSLSGAKKNVDNTNEIFQDRTQQQQLLDNAETQYESSKKQFESYTSNLSQVKENLENATKNYFRMKNLYKDSSISKQQFELSETQFKVLKEQYDSSLHSLEQIKKNMEGSKTNYLNVKKIYENRLQQKLQLDNSITQEKIAESNLKLAQEKLNLIISPAKKEELDTLRATVEQAQAGVKLSEIQLSKSTIISPINGNVILKSFEEGETVVAGSPLIVLADISKVFLKVYIPVSQIGNVKIGQKAIVTVDSFEDKTFEGTIKYISPKAEFTPKNVQTKEERVNQVFEVKISISNKNGLLKSGMPADANILF